MIKCKKMHLALNSDEIFLGVNRGVPLGYLALNPDKIFLGVNKGVLLGYVVNEKEREPDPEKIAVIGGLATPTNANAKTCGVVPRIDP